MYDFKPPTYLEPYRDLLLERVQMSGITDLLPMNETILVSAAQREDLFRVVPERLRLLSLHASGPLTIRSSSSESVFLPMARRDGR
jgi:hypothetical protein